MLLTTFSDFRGRILEYINLAFGFKDLTLEKTLSTGHYRFYTFPIGDHNPTLYIYSVIST